MKKLFYVLSLFLMTSPIKSGLFSRSEKDDDLEATDPLTIGTKIDKSNAKDSGGKYKFGITNFFVIGDSLSDVNGLTTYIKDRMAKIKLDTNLTITGEAYGFKNGDEFYNSFTNGPTAAFIIAEKLGLKTFNSSNRFSKTDDIYGKNYAVAGATAGKVPSASGILLNDVRADVQARTLISQQIINKKDIVFFEIGGNDLLTLVKLKTDLKAQESFMDDSVKRIRNVFFTLLNNGVKNIVFMTPPKIDFPPIFYDIFLDAEKEEEQNLILNPCIRFYEKIQEVLNEVQKYYPRSIEVFDLFHYSKLAEWRWLFTVKWKNRKIAKQNLRINATELKDIKIKIDFGDDNIIEPLNLKEVTLKIPRIIRQTIKNGRKVSIIMESGPIIEEQDIQNFFFVDKLHPSESVHKLMSKYIYKKIKKQVKKRK